MSQIAAGSFPRQGRQSTGFLRRPKLKYPVLFPHCFPLVKSLSRPETFLPDYTAPGDYLFLFSAVSPPGKPCHIHVWGSSLQLKGVHPAGPSMVLRVNRPSVPRVADRQALPSIMRMWGSLIPLLGMIGFFGNAIRETQHRIKMSAVLFIGRLITYLPPSYKSRIRHSKMHLFHILPFYQAMPCRVPLRWVGQSPACPPL